MACGENGPKRETLGRGMHLAPSGTPHQRQAVADTPAMASPSIGGVTCREELAGDSRNQRKPTPGVEYRSSSHPASVRATEANAAMRPGLIAVRMPQRHPAASRAPLFLWETRGSPCSPTVRSGCSLLFACRAPRTGLARRPTP